MKILNKYKIGAHIFKTLRLGGLPVDDNFGKAGYERLQLFIRDDVPQSLQEETFIHEVIHIIRVLTGTDLPDEKEEERVVQSMGHLFYLFLKENDLLK